MSTYPRIRDLREDSDLKQKELAAYLFMHLTQYRRYETGESELPMWVAVKLAQFYGISLDYLSGLSDIKEPNSLHLTSDEQKYLTLFRSLTDIQKGRILERMDIMAVSSKNKRFSENPWQANVNLITVQLAALLHDVDDIKLSPDTYANTDTAKKIAEQRENYMRSYISEFLDEWDGIR